MCALRYSVGVGMLLPPSSSAKPTPAPVATAFPPSSLHYLPKEKREKEKQEEEEDFREAMADTGTVLVSPGLRRRASYRALACSPSGAHGGVTFSLEPPCEEELRHAADACFRCRRSLRASSDVFMYRGNTPFCSEECRQEQIELDEAQEREMRYRRRRNQQPLAASGKQAPASAQHNLRARASDAIFSS